MFLREGAPGKFKQRAGPDPIDQYTPEIKDHYLDAVMRHKASLFNRFSIRMNPWFPSVFGSTAENFYDMEQLPSKLLQAEKIQ
jgi:SUMO ligase MMS21 Smc5/6 complex component